MEKSPYNGHLDGHLIKSTVKSENFLITGVMSSPKVDLENEIIDRSAYADAISKVKSRFESGNPLKLFLEHRRKECSLPIGNLIDAWEDKDKGLMFKARIANSSITSPIKELIREGVLQGCSIGGEALKSIPYFDPKIGKDVKKIIKMDLRELSLTGLPVSEESIFSMTKSLYCAGKCDGKSNSIQKSCDSCGPKCFKNRLREVKKSVAKLNKAISTERHIQTLEKAAEMAEQGKPINLEDAKRIEEALKNLGGLLGIELGGSAGEGVPDEGMNLPQAQPQEPPMEEPAPEQPVPEQPAPEEPVPEEQPEESVEEEPIPQPKPAMKPKPAKPEMNTAEAPNGALEYTDEEDAVQDEDSEDMVENPEMGGKDEVKEKLDRILALLSNKDEDGDGEFAEDDDVDGEDVEENKNIDEGGEKMENGTFCKKCQLSFNKSQVDYDVNYCPICGDTINPKAKVVSKSCPQCKNSFYKSFDIDEDAALEAEYDLCFCPQCGAKLIAGKAKEEEGEELINEGAEETAEGNEGGEVGENPMEEEIEEGREKIARKTADEDADFEADEDSDEDDDEDEDLMIDLDKALASIAVATQPKGAKTVRDGKYPDKTPAAKTSYPSKDIEGMGSIKVADSPKGAQTKFTTKAQKKANVLKNLEIETGSHEGDSGPAISDFDEKYVDPSTGERTDSADSTLHEMKENYFQPMENGAPDERWKNYEKDRKMKKSSLEDEVTSLRKSIDELKSMSTRKGIVTNTVMVPNAEPTQEAMDRHLAQLFTGKLKA